MSEGGNDIGTAAATEAAQKAVAENLITAYDRIVTRARTGHQGVATLTPFGGNSGYDDPAGAREAARQRRSTTGSGRAAGSTP